MKKLTDQYEAQKDALDKALKTAKEYAGWTDEKSDQSEVLDQAKSDEADGINDTDPKVTKAALSTALDGIYQSVLDELVSQYQSALDVFRQRENAITNAGQVILGYDYATEPTADAKTDPEKAAKDDPGYVLYGDLIASIDLATIGDSTPVTDVIKGWGSGDFKSITEGDIKDLAGEAEFNIRLNEAISAVSQLDLTQFVTDDELTCGTKTKSSYEWASIVRSTSLEELRKLKWEDDDEYDTDYETAIKAIAKVYNVKYAGTLGENHEGTFFKGSSTDYLGIDALKTVGALTTDNAKIEYAKQAVSANVKAAIEAQRATKLKVQNDIIFAQTIAKKPNQAAIDAANEKIAKINKQYDALLEVMLYRIDTAEYVVTAPDGDGREFIRARYNDAYYDMHDVRGDGTAKDRIATFKNGKLLTGDSPTYTYLAWNNLTVDKLLLTAAEAEAIVDLIETLKQDAELAKISIAVDGATAKEVDEALEAATKKVYMTGDLKVELSISQSDTLLHRHAHKLMGTACVNDDEVDSEANPLSSVTVYPAAKTVTIGGVTYPTIAEWDTSETKYCPDNSTIAEGIATAAETNIMAAATVAEADQIFLDAYAQYQAVITRVQQRIMFAYGGAMYGKDVQAREELKAYIDYQAALMGATIPNAAVADGTVATLNKDYNTATASGGEAGFLENVVDDASLAAAVAEAKAFIDALKTKDELKAEGKALIDDINKVDGRVASLTLAQEDTVFALVDRMSAYTKYCAKVAYQTAPELTIANNVLTDDLKVLAKYRKDELDAMVKALGPVAKLTLAQKADVDTFIDAESFYNTHYKAAAGEYAGPNGEKGSYYDAKIWELRVRDVETQIAVLPVEPTTAQVAAVLTALKDLGFEGLCDVDDAYLTKLDKFDQDSAANEIANVKSLKVYGVHSKATKGKMKIMWSVRGDLTGVQELRIYRSTKMNEGYKLIYKAGPTRTSYTNTKSLKKGTTYHYKIRAYAKIDGKTYFSDYSNKAYRKAK